MRKQVLSKTVALIAAMGLAVSSVNVAYAGESAAGGDDESSTSSGNKTRITEGETGSKTSGQTDNTTSDSAQETEKETVKNIQISGKQEESTFDGNVSNSESTTGVELNDGLSSGKLDSKITVTGNVEVSNKDDNQSQINTYATGVSISSYVGGKGNVEIFGGVKTDATQQTNSYSAATGIYTNTNAEIKVGGDVEALAKGSQNSQAQGISYDNNYTSNNTVNTEVLGNVVSSANNGFATGLKISATSNDKTTIGKDVKADGSGAYGIWIEGNGAEDKSTEILVGGDVEAKASQERAGDAVLIETNKKNVDITVNGNIKASGYAIRVLQNKSEHVNITSGGTISSSSVAPIVITATDDGTQNDNNDKADDQDEKK